MRPLGRGVVAATVSSCVLASAFFGCIDLFHSTNFETLCDIDAIAPGCTDAAQTGREGGAKHDAPGPDSHPTHDAGGDAGRDAHTGSEGGGGQHDTGVDAGPTNFCAWTPAEAAKNAEYACGWLGACAGTGGANEFGHCYPLAVLAYDCTANPNQQVLGPVHDYWDRLWQTKSCSGVMDAIFPSGVPACSGAPCISATVVASCADGGVAAAQNCAAEGLVCTSGVCAVKNYLGCGGEDNTPRCDNGVISHMCKTIAGNPTDIGKDCTNFGAGSCRLTDGGLAGCVPGESAGDASCDASVAVTCSDSGVGTIVQGCATGQREQINCSVLGGDGGVIDCIASTAATRPDLSSVCYTPTTLEGSCSDGGVQLTDHAGASGIVEVTCASLGLGPCVSAGATATCSP